MSLLCEQRRQWHDNTHFGYVCTLTDAAEKKRCASPVPKKGKKLSKEEQREYERRKPTSNETPVNQPQPADQPAPVDQTSQRASRTSAQRATESIRTQTEEMENMPSLDDVSNDFLKQHNTKESSRRAAIGYLFIHMFNGHFLPNDEWTGKSEHTEDKSKD